MLFKEQSNIDMKYVYHLDIGIVLKEIKLNQTSK